MITGSKLDGENLPGVPVFQHDDGVNYRFLRISSNEILNGTSTAFQVSFGGSNTLLQKTMETHLVDAIIPNVNPNVTAARGNSTFLLTYSVGGTQHVTLPDGQYTTGQILTALNTGFVGLAPGTTTFSQNPNSNKVTITIVGNTAHITAGDAADPSLDFSLGFTTSSGAFSGTIVAPSIPSLSGDTVFFIHSSVLSQNRTYLNSDTGVINDVNGFVTIPVTVPFGGNQTWRGSEFDGRLVLGSSGKSTITIDITIRTNGGALLPPIPPNMEIILVFKLYYRPPNMRG